MGSVLDQYYGLNLVCKSGFYLVLTRLKSNQITQFIAPIFIFFKEFSLGQCTSLCYVSFEHYVWEFCSVVLFQEVQYKPYNSLTNHLPHK